jgi:type VI secretion system secreted protein VgrG
METYVKVEVELDGRKKIETLSHITIAQRHNWHHTFELSMPLDDIEGKDKTGFDQSKNFIGKGIKVSITAVEGSETFNQFNGIITDISITRHSGTGADVVFKGYSPTILLDDGENTKCFSEKSISQIVSEVTKGYPKDLSVKANPSPDTKFEYLVQYRESNFSFLTRLAEETGKWFYYDGKDVQFGKLNSSNKVDMRLGNDLSSFDLGMHVKPLKFSDSSYDYINNSVVKVPSSSIKVAGLDSVGNELSGKSDQLFSKDLNALPYQKIKNQSELKEFSTNKKSAASSSLNTISGVSYNPKLKIGTKIDVSSNDLDKSSTNYGSFIIISVTHFTDSLGVYQGKFEAISANITIPPSNPNVSYPTCETQPAVVSKNNDSDGYGRVKVKFPWQTDVETPWIRIVNHHAGKNKGFQFIPEVDDEVLIAFENNNPSRPFVMGSLYHGKASHKDRNDKDNLIKTIRTKSGNEIKFYDKGGEEEILIHNKDSQNHITLSLKDDGKITIKSKNKMELFAKEILIEAEKKLTMKSKETSMSGKDKVEILTEKDCIIKSSDTKIETQKNLTMKAGVKAELKATAGLDIDGGPKTTVKSSGMMELNGGGQATLKAGIVMIN